MEEEIVLLDEGGYPAGTMPKKSGHNFSTQLHLGFSCYLVDARGRVLVTRRSHSKLTFPAVVTNGCCGHPGPEETLRKAVTRRVHAELGIWPEAITLILPQYRYRATAADGTVENELCPVVRAESNAALAIEPAEVGAAFWCDWPDCRSMSQSADASPWFRDQMAMLWSLGRPREWPAGDPGLLPPAIAW